MDDSEMTSIYSRINKIDNRVTALEQTNTFIQDMIKRNVESNERLETTMQTIQATLIQLNDQSSHQLEKIENMRSDFEKANEATNKRIENVGSKVEVLEDKGKFDIQEFIKKNWPTIVVLFGLGALYVAQFVKF